MKARQADSDAVRRRVRRILAKRRHTAVVRNTPQATVGTLGCSASHGSERARLTSYWTQHRLHVLYRLYAVHLSAVRHVNLTVAVAMALAHSTQVTTASKALGGPTASLKRCVSQGSRTEGATTQAQGAVGSGSEYRGLQPHREALRVPHLYARSNHCAAAATETRPRRDPLTRTLCFPAVLLRRRWQWNAQWHVGATQASRQCHHDPQRAGYLLRCLCPGQTTCMLRPVLPCRCSSRQRGAAATAARYHVWRPN